MLFPYTELMKMNSVKALVESSDLTSIPSIYTYFKSSKDEHQASDPQDSIPVIDYSLLTSTDPELQSHVLQELDNACKDWGFFQLINHGVPETLMHMVIEKSIEFFNLRDEEKKAFQRKNALDPIIYGTSFNSKKDTVFYWRDFLRLIVHPEFHCPNNPVGLSEVLFEYSKRIRNLTRGLLQGISKSLGLDKSSVEKTLQMDLGVQTVAINLYPPCPQPELAIGLPPHSDHGLFTLLINNGIGGLQIKHKGKWINVNNTLPNSILVNTADQLEIFSNGKYKSVEHCAVVNNAVTRLSVGVANGPSLDAVVAPASMLVDGERCPAAYLPMTYKEYIETQQGNHLVSKTCLERVRI